MRNVSLEGLQSLIAAQTESVWCFGVVFEAHEDEDPKYPTTYFTNNMQNFWFPAVEGNEYVALPFEVTLANDNEESPPQAKLRIDNVSREFSAIIRATEKPPTGYLYVFRLETVKQGDGTVKIEPHLELGPSEFVLLSAGGNAITVEGVIGYEHDILNEPACQHHFTPTLTPGIYN